MSKSPSGTGLHAGVGLVKGKASARGTELHCIYGPPRGRCCIPTIAAIDTGSEIPCPPPDGPGGWARRLIPKMPVVEDVAVEVGKTPTAKAKEAKAKGDKGRVAVVAMAVSLLAIVAMALPLPPWRCPRSPICRRRRPGTYRPTGRVARVRKIPQA